MKNLKLLIGLLPLQLGTLGYLGCGEEFSSFPPDDVDASATDASSDEHDAGPETDGQVQDGNKPDVSDSDSEPSADAPVDALSDVAEGGLPPGCLAGVAGTVDSVTVSGLSGAGLLVHFNDPNSGEAYDTINPALVNLQGLLMPGQLVLAGKDGFQFQLRNGVSDMAKPWYKAGNLPTDQCGDVNLFQTEACLSATAKSFRCQFAPYLETTNCPVLPVHFTAQGEASSHTESATGWVIILIDLTCP